MLTLRHAAIARGVDVWLPRRWSNFGRMLGMATVECVTFDWIIVDCSLGASREDLLHGQSAVAFAHTCSCHGQSVSHVPGLGVPQSHLVSILYSYWQLAVETAVSLGPQMAPYLPVPSAALAPWLGEP